MTHGHLTETDIVAAANFIAAQGEIPTIAAVRQHLNGRGSETTILNYLRKWKIKLLEFAVYVEESEGSVDQIISMRQQIESLQEKIEDQNLVLQNLSSKVTHYETENIVLKHGIRRLNNQHHELTKHNHALQTEIKYIRELNSELNAVEALVQQTVQNYSLNDKPANNATALIFIPTP